MHDEELGRDELLALLNELLEAERAGARLMLRTAADAEDAAFRHLAASIHHDEVKWCGVLIAAIRALHASPSTRTGAFYDKAMAVPDLRDRMALLNRGQGWVVKRLRTLLPRIQQEGIGQGLADMLASHEMNIVKVDAHLRTGS